MLVLIGSNPVFGSGGRVQRIGAGTEENPYQVPRSESAIRIDAVLNEPAWENAFKLELRYEVSPGENVDPPVRTEVLLTYNDEVLFAAFRCHDPDPAAIRAHVSDRDNIGGDDWVGIILDTFNDKRRSYDLLVNPLGVQEDFIESQSGGGSWDAIWNSAGQITEWGYIVEMAIPFDQLRFQRRDGKQVWGFDAVRRYPRSQSHHIGAFPRDRSNSCYLCQAVRIEGFQGAKPGRNIEISPTVVGVRTDVRNDWPNGDFEEYNEDGEVGVTVAWGLTPNMTLSGTFNPDFSQVEADAFQLDINQPFALYYSERRPFFVESMDFFRTLKDVVYTRAIRDPQWGVKLTGKEGVNTFGTFVVQDEMTNLIFPGSESSSSTSLKYKSAASVLRYKRDIGNRYTIAAYITDREADDYHNRLIGFDADLRLTWKDQIQLQLLASSTKYPEETAVQFEQNKESFEDRFIAFEYDHNTRSLSWWLDYDEVGPEFRADLGYIPRVGYRNIEGGSFYTWNAPSGSWWSTIMAGIELNYYEDWDQKPIDRGGSAWFYYSGISQTSLNAQYGHYREAYNGFMFDLNTYYVSASIRPTGQFWAGISVSFGDRIDYSNTRPGDRLRLVPYAGFNLGKHLRLRLNHTFERMSVDLGRLYSANISGLTARYHINTRAFFRAILQYVYYDYSPENYTYEVDPEYKCFSAQLLFAYKFNPRTMLYLGYNGNHFGTEQGDLVQFDRTFFMKLGYAWII
jgi:hypothetical protein